MIQKAKTTDPILDEIHRTRREIADRFNGDLRAILDDARKRQAVSGRPTWSPRAANHALQRSGDGEVSDDGESTPAAR